MWSSPLPTNTLKVHLYVEQFSQKTNWKLADLPYNQSCKKDLHVTGLDEKKKRGIRLGLAPLGGITKEEMVHVGRP